MSSPHIHRCASCGAAAAPADTTCAFCGSTLIWHATGTTSTAAREALFDRIKASPAYHQRNHEQREAAVALREAQRQIGRIAPWKTGLFVGAVVVGTGALLIGLWPVPMLIVGGWWLYRKLTGVPPLVSQVVTSDGRPEAAIVIAKRMQVYGTGSAITTRYFITIELEDGTRHELETLSPTTYGDVAEGDAGIAFTAQRRTVLTFFDRVSR